LLRYHPKLGFIRLSIVGHRYYDRGAGGFMAGRGEWVHEGRVTCATYPEILDRTPRIPAIKSIAGWGFTGSVPITNAPGENIEIADKQASRPEAELYEAAFWTIGEAIAYANGDDGGDIARDTTPVKVRCVDGAYKLAVLAEGGRERIQEGRNAKHIEWPNA
jgi:hypothetical protein